jgi:hypothetical protein
MMLASASQHVLSVKQLTGVRINIVLRVYIECSPIKFVDIFRGQY